MSVEDRGSVQSGRLRWPRHPDHPPSRPESMALYTYLLDVDGELADQFDVRGRVVARQLATARVLQVEAGGWDRESLECDMGIPGRVRPVGNIP